MARLGDGAVEDFAGGRMTSAEDWRAASPARLLPLGVPIRCVHGDRDDTVPIEQSERFVMAARLLGDDARSTGAALRSATVRTNCCNPPARYCSASPLSSASIVWLSCCDSSTVVFQ